MTDIEKLETLRKLEKLQKDYSLGLNYIRNSNNSKSLEQQYIERLKELKEEILQIKQTDENKITQRSK